MILKQNTFNRGGGYAKYPLTQAAFTLAEGATHVAMQHNNRKFAFTLAEVLVTLAVIGIVAAMTIPNLVQSYKKREVETKLLHFYSAMNQAVKLSEIDNGEISQWYKYVKGAHTTDDDGKPIESSYPEDIFFQKYLSPYIKIVSRKLHYNKDWSTGRVCYGFSDGSFLCLDNGNNCDWLFYLKEPTDCNTSYGTCRFSFRFAAPESNNNWEKLPLEPTHFNLTNNDNIDTIAERCKNPTKDYASVPGGAYCTMWIKLNGWKIPEDYPFKF